MATHDASATLTRPTFAAPVRVLLVVAPFYRDIADALTAGARRALDAAGVAHETLEVPGALEIPTAIALASRADAFDGYVALGCVIRGETTHYETVCNDSSRGLTLLGLQVSILVGGTVVLESVFVLPGMGRYLLEAVQYRDYPVIQGLNLLFATVIILANLLVDLLYGWLDPRVRYQ